MASLDSSLLSILGDRTAAVLDENLGLKTVSDLLRHYPRRYVIRGELTDIESLIEGEEVTIFAKVESSKVKRIPGRKSAILETVVTDGRAKLTLTFFNQAWREKELRPGRQGLFAGKVGLFKGKLCEVIPTSELRISEKIGSILLEKQISESTYTTCSNLSDSTAWINASQISTDCCALINCDKEIKINTISFFMLVI
ncbi:MAG: hypothetical protein EBU38_00920 [Actinobacteria bacterium]|nr:hypothetical protein [Actinomycetota bacterium]